MAHHYSLAIQQAFWKLPDVTHFPSNFYVHACRSGKRAINNIYRSLGVPRQRESVYVTNTLNTLSTIHGHRYIGGFSTTHSRLTPLPKEPSRISLMYLIFLETTFSRWQFVYIFTQFCLMSAATSRKTFLFLKEGRFGRSRSSKVDKFGANRKRGMSSY